jgi:hypothetical protein
MEVSGQLYSPAALPPGKKPLVSIARSRGGGEEKNSQLLPGLEHPIIQIVDQHYTTELSRLLFTTTYRTFLLLVTLIFKSLYF